ncbi:MAG: hypothetical protein HRT47_06890 [Candidatus Caenarcaniphilales bacterium]|nr:hypothetical protein [Candidatus Caenarcaniphilales bacterium]
MIQRTEILKYAGAGAKIRSNLTPVKPTNVRAFNQFVNNLKEVKGVRAMPIPGLDAVALINDEQAEQLSSLKPNNFARIGQGLVNFSQKGDSDKIALKIVYTDGNKPPKLSENTEVVEVSMKELIRSYAMNTSLSNGLTKNPYLGVHRMLETLSNANNSKPSTPDLMRNAVNNMTDTDIMPTPPQPQTPTPIPPPSTPGKITHYNLADLGSTTDMSVDSLSGVPELCDKIEVNSSGDPVIYGFNSGTNQDSRDEMNALNLLAGGRVIDASEVKQLSGLDIGGVAFSSVRGSIEKKQEDGVYLAFAKNGAISITVVDGMGGYQGGDRAKDHIINEFRINPFDRKKAAEAASKAIKQDKAITNHKAGAVLSANIIWQDPNTNKLYLEEAHMGDTHTYIFNEDGSLAFSSREDSFVQTQLDAGFSADDPTVYNHKDRSGVSNPINRNNGANFHGEKDPIELKKGQFVITISDGVGDNVHYRELTEMVKESKGDLNLLNEKIANATSIQMRNYERIRGGRQLNAWVRSETHDGDIDKAGRVSTRNPGLVASAIEYLRYDPSDDTQKEFFDEFIKNIDDAIDNNRGENFILNLILAYATDQIELVSGHTAQELNNAQFMKEYKPDNCGMIITKI